MTRLRSIFSPPLSQGGRPWCETRTAEGRLTLLATTPSGRILGRTGPRTAPCGARKCPLPSRPAGRPCSFLISRPTPLPLRPAESRSACYCYGRWKTLAGHSRSLSLCLGGRLRVPVVNYDRLSNRHVRPAPNADLSRSPNVTGLGWRFAYDRGLRGGGLISDICKYVYGKPFKRKI